LKENDERLKAEKIENLIIGFDEDLKGNYVDQEEAANEFLSSASSARGEYAEIK